MKKIALPLFMASALTACMGTGQSSVQVTQNEVLSNSCASVHMQTINGLPMRCGPQSVKPYTYQ